MDALLTVIILWLSANFGLPANYEHPRVEFVPPSKIVALRYRGLSGLQAPAAAGTALPGQREAVAVYDVATKTIFLRDDWSGKSPADLSVLVHEVVHHLQALGKLKFECPQEREQLAFTAQEKWLNLFGTNLEREFEIDPFTLLVTTKCMH